MGAVVVGYGSGYGSGSGSGDGSGYGSGYGDGSGSGSGDGYGDGYGSGYGYGYGSGSGYGDGSGSGYGSGSGSGYGYGYGYGDGSGYGSGYGKTEYLQAILAPHAGQRSDAQIAFWRSTADGRPANGGTGTVAKVGLVEEIKGPLKICTERALHATMEPWNWKGDRLWVVALYGEVQQEGDKFGALKREFVADLGPCPF